MRARMASEAWLPNLVGEVSMWNLAGDLNRPSLFDGRLLVPSLEGPDNLPTRVEWNVTGLVPLAEAGDVERAIEEFAQCVERAAELFDDPAFAKFRPAFTLPSLESPHYFYGAGKLFVANWGAAPRRISQRSGLVIDALRFSQEARARVAHAAVAPPPTRNRLRLAWLALLPLFAILALIVWAHWPRDPGRPRPEPIVDAPPPIRTPDAGAIVEPPPPLPAPHQKIFFARGDHALSDDQRESLDAIAAYLREHEQVTALLIEGHADDTGSESDNFALSVERARRVREWVVSAGIERSRLRAAGCSELHPVATNENDEGQRTNRRVELFVIDPPVDPPPHEGCRSAD